MRAEEGDESIQDYADEAQETRSKVSRGLRHVRLRRLLGRFTGVLRRK